MLRRDEIPRGEWPTFFKSFVAQHQGHLCSLGVVDDHNAPRLHLTQLLLAELDRAISEGVGGIRVVLAHWSGERLAHVITAPRHVFFHHPADGAGETLEIDGQGGKTVMRFEAPS